jgi:hypothetical protein
MEHQRFDWNHNFVSGRTTAMKSAWGTEKACVKVDERRSHPVRNYTRTHKHRQITARMKSLLRRRLLLTPRKASTDKLYIIVIVVPPLSLSLAFPDPTPSGLSHPHTNIATPGVFSLAPSFVLSLSQQINKPDKIRVLGIA